MSSSASTPSNRDPATIAEYFGRLAATYGDGAYYGMRRRAVLEAIAPEFGGARNVLDLGCGNASYLGEFANAPGRRRLVGADLTFDMLKAARQRVPPTCGLIRANASQLPLKSGSFDFIFASHVLPFVNHLDEVIAEVVRCVSRGGVLIVTGQRDDSIRRVMNEIVGAERWQKYSEVIFRRAPRQHDARRNILIHEAFAKVGLHVEERHAPFTIAWPDIDEWIRIRWRPLIPEAERERADRMLAELAQLAASRTVDLYEPLILGRKPPA